MAHLTLAPELPGILGPLAFRPETAAPLLGLAEVLLRGESTLTRGERELGAGWRHARTDDDVAAARAEGATDVEIHDVVLIAAAFCMFNRYVDGLGTWAPVEREAYAESAARIVSQGYLAH